MHDVGKIGIPEAILLKPGRLDEDEMAIMRTHVTLGEDIVKGMGWLDGTHEVVAAHHKKKLDGSGYPRGLVGEQIPLAAPIFAVADRGLRPSGRTARPEPPALPKGASRPDDSSPQPPMPTAHNCSGRHDLHAIALARVRAEARQRGKISVP